MQETDLMCRFSERETALSRSLMLNFDKKQQHLYQDKNDKYTLTMSNYRNIPVCFLFDKLLGERFLNFKKKKVKQKPFHIF